MLLSVIIPTCNRNDLLSKCLDLLAPSIQKVGEEYEVIITDDGKSFPAKELIEAKYPWAMWVQGPQKGPAANRNNGAGVAKGEWLIFIDDDCLPDRNVLNAYKLAISEYAIGEAFEGSIYPDNWEMVNQDLAECPVNTDGGNFWSANICIKKSLFKKIKGFDETYPLAAFEDQDIYFRIQDYTKVVFLPRANVIHPVRFIGLWKNIKSSSAKCIAWAYHTNKNRLKLGYKNKTAFIIDGYRIQAKTFLRVIKKGKWKQAIISLVHIFYGLPVMNIKAIKGLKK